MVNKLQLLTANSSKVRQIPRNLSSLINSLKTKVSRKWRFSTSKMVTKNPYWKMLKSMLEVPNVPKLAQILQQMSILPFSVRKRWETYLLKTMTLMKPHLREYQDRALPLRACQPASCQSVTSKSSLVSKTIQLPSSLRSATVLVNLAQTLATKRTKPTAKSTLVSHWLLSTALIRQGPLTIRTRNLIRVSSTTVAAQSTSVLLTQLTPSAPSVSLTR